MANTVRQTGNVGARLDLRVRKGASLETHSITLSQTPTGSAATPPFSLVGYLVRAWCKGRGAAAATRLDFTVGRPDDVNGQITLDMPPATTTQLPSPIYSTSPPEVLDWWLEIEGPSGVITPIFYGEYEVNA